VKRPAACAEFEEFRIAAARHRGRIADQARDLADRHVFDRLHGKFAQLCVRLGGDFDVGAHREGMGAGLHRWRAVGAGEGDVEVFEAEGGLGGRRRPKRRKGSNRHC
jgi:hypothetical protein